MNRSFLLRALLVLSVLAVGVPACTTHESDSIRPQAALPSILPLTVADARSWYQAQAGPLQPAAAARGSSPTKPVSGPLPIDWANAVDTTADAHAVVFAPVRDFGRRFIDAGYQTFRYLVVTRSGPTQPSGMVVEVFLKDAHQPSKALGRALLARLYTHHRSAVNTLPGNFTGYAFFYTADYRYLTGTGYAKGRALAGTMRLTRAIPVVVTPPKKNSTANKTTGCTTYLIKGGTADAYYEEICGTEPDFGNLDPGQPGFFDPGYGGAADAPTTGGGATGGGSGPSAVTQIITDPSITNNEKANCIYTKLLNNPNFQNLLTAFRNSTQYNVQFSLGNAGNNTGTTHWNYGTSTAEITIGADALGYQHAIWGATTFFHEAFHANLQQHAIATFGNFEISSWPKPINDMTLQELVTFVDASATKNQAWLTATHNFMASNIAIMADGLQVFVQNNFPATYAQIGNNPDAYKALALMGLQNSQYWASSTTAQQQEYLRLMNEFVTSELPDCTK